LAAERKPSTTDYIMGTILSYSLVYIWLNDFVNKMPGMHILVSVVVYYLTGTLTSFLVCRKTTEAHLSVGIKMGLLSQVFTVFTMYVVTGTLNMVLFFIILICFLLGGATGAYISLRKRILSPLEPETE
jgi:uncharacterized membrane protein